MMDLKKLKMRLQQKAGNYATTPEEAIVAEASLILRRKEDGGRLVLTTLALWGPVIGLYWGLGIRDLLTGNMDLLTLQLAPVVTAYGLFFIWRSRAKVKEAEDPRYDWVLEYGPDVMVWRVQRNQERKSRELRQKWPPLE